MRSFLDAKTIAKTLRQELQNRKIELGHSECLEVVARQFGFRDWNTLAAEQAGKAIPSGNDLLPLPKGWEAAGRITKIYRYGIRSKGGPNGEPAILVGARSEYAEKISPTELIFCSIQQRVKATHFRGKRVEFALELCGENVSDRAYPFVSIFDENGRFLRGFDHWSLPRTTRIEGTEGWRPASIVVDVPENAASVEFGITLHGFSGHVRASNLSFRETLAPLTSLRSSDLDQPQNLDLQVA